MVGGNLLVSHDDIDVIDDDDVNVNVDIDDDHLFCHLVNLVRSQPDRICGYCPQEIGVTDLLMTMVKILSTLRRPTGESSWLPEERIRIGTEGGVEASQVPQPLLW